MTNTVVLIITAIYWIMPINTNMNIHENNNSSIEVCESKFNNSEPIIVTNGCSDIYSKKIFSEYTAKETEIYYFVDSLFNSKSLMRDTLILNKEKINSKSPQIELHSDSYFKIIFDIEYLDVKNKNSGTQLLVQKSKEIKGTFSIEVISKEEGIINDEIMKLKTDDGESFRFRVIEKKNNIYWVKISDSQ